MQERIKQFSAKWIKSKNWIISGREEKACNPTYVLMLLSKVASSSTENEACLTTGLLLSLTIHRRTQGLLADTQRLTEHKS